MENFSGLSVTIPTIDEFQTIETVVKTINDTCKSDDIAEVILIHPAQSANSYIELLNGLKQKYPLMKIKVVLQKKPGIGAAVYEAFYGSIGSHVTAIGADLENNPADISQMIELAKKHPQKIITASRRLNKDCFSDYPPIKRLFNIAFQLMLKIMFKTKQSDITYVFQCTPVSVLHKYDFNSSISTFVLALALVPEIHDWPFEEIPSRVGKRQYGKSHLSLKYYFNFIKEVFTLLTNKESDNR